MQRRYVEENADIAIFFEYVSASALAYQKQIKRYHPLSDTDYG